MANTVIGVFSNREEADTAVSSLKGKGYNANDISIVMKDSETAKEMSTESGVNAVAGGTMEGAGKGAVVGGIAGLLAGTVLPGLGGFLIGGPIGAALGLTGAAATTVSGAATGAVAGGLIGALTSMFGLAEEDARMYETRVSEGGILVAVPAKGEDGEEVEDILVESGADDVRTVNK